MSNTTFKQFLNDLENKKMSFLKYTALMQIATPLQREIVNAIIGAHYAK